MGIFKKQNDYYIDYYVQGRRKREKIGPNRKLAERVLAKRKVQIAENRFLDIKKVTNARLEDFAKEYLEFSRVSNKPQSYRRYTVSMKSLLKFFAGKYLHEITPQDIEKYKAMRREKRTCATVNRGLACLKHLFSKAIEREKMATNPVKQVKLFMEKNKRIRYLTQNEYQLLLTYAVPHLRPIIQTAVYTGLRLGEILNLKWIDIDLQNDIILVIESKNNESREVPINTSLKEVLSGLVRRIDSPYVFYNEDGKPYTTIKRALKTALKRADISDFRFHDLRHTFASWLVMRGVSLQIVQELLGHKTYQMTLRYAHLSPSIKKEAVERLVEGIEERGNVRKKEKAYYDAEEARNGHLYGHQMKDAGH